MGLHSRRDPVSGIDFDVCSPELSAGMTAKLAGGRWDVEGLAFGCGGYHTFFCTPNPPPSHEEQRPRRHDHGYPKTIAFQSFVEVVAQDILGVALKRTPARKI